MNAITLFSVSFYKEKTRRNRRADVLPTISKSLVESGKLFIERAAITLIYDAFGLWEACPTAFEERRFMKKKGRYNADFFIVVIKIERNQRERRYTG